MLRRKDVANKLDWIKFKCSMAELPVQYQD